MFGVDDIELAYQVQSLYLKDRLAVEKAVGYKGALTAAPMDISLAAYDGLDGVVAFDMTAANFGAWPIF